MEGDPQPLEEFLCHDVLALAGKQSFVFGKLGKDLLAAGPQEPPTASMIMGQNATPSVLQALSVSRYDFLKSW